MQAGLAGSGLRGTGDGAGGGSSSDESSSSSEDEDEEERHQISQLLGPPPPPPIPPSTEPLQVKFRVHSFFKLILFFYAVYFLLTKLQHFIPGD